MRVNASKKGKYLRSLLSQSWKSTRAIAWFSNASPKLNHAIAMAKRSLLGQVMSVSLDGNRQERSRGFITIIQIAL
ncbi:hypothetical protein [Nostoc commune]|uniref:hypothetical protein n=1 Tax=Nostoc commune TaxID=1178 RepID=UPI0018C73A63|nr:hypothetical protein [Nostoc commune]MBG1260366.1 hypothetical protein [Nostoc commune BAE]